MIIFVLIILGLCFGSFANALVWRMRMQETVHTKKAKRAYSIAHGRSMCTHCRHVLAPKDLVPIASWILLRGRCRYCRKRIQDTPLAELLFPTLLVVSHIFWPYNWSAQSIALFSLWSGLILCFVALIIYDIRWFLLPNKIVLVATGLAGGQLLVRLLSEPAKQVLLGALWGALIGGGIFWVLFQISDGKWIGGGDVKLGAVLGAITGGPLKALLIIFIASLIGTVMTAPQTILKSVSRKTQIPFGPFLIIATIIVYLFGTSLIVWYKNQAGL